MTKEFDAKNAEKSRRVCAAMEDMANNMRRCGEVRHDCEKGATTAATTDAVSHPSHYTSGGVECIDGIRAALAPEEYRGYLRGNVLKYIWRCRLKGGVEDLRKARVYLDWLIEEMEEE